MFQNWASGMKIQLFVTKWRKKRWLNMKMPIFFSVLKVLFFLDWLSNQVYTVFIATVKGCLKNPVWISITLGLCGTRWAPRLPTNDCLKGQSAWGWSRMPHYSCSVLPSPLIWRDECERSESEISRLSLKNSLPSISKPFSLPWVMDLRLNYSKKKLLLVDTF